MTTQTVTPEAVQKHIGSVICPDNPAERLYLAYVPKADELAKRLCFHFRASGALAFEKDAQSHARIALWKCAVKFDPKKQRLQRMKIKKQQEESIQAILFGYPEPKHEPYDPYSNFWIASIRRVSGAVLDLFRAERLITKPQNGEVSDTMLYYERFQSLDRPLSDASNGNSRDSFGDMLPSKDRADKNDEISEMRYQIESIKQDAELSENEQLVIELSYSEEDLSKSEVAERMGMSGAAVTALLAKALEKMRQVRLQPT